MVEREKEVRRLLEDVSKLENVRDKQAVKISALQDKMHSVDDDVNRTLFSSDNAVRTLSNELRFLKSSLAQVTEREQRVGKSKHFASANMFLIFLVAGFPRLSRPYAWFRCQHIICA